MSSFINATSSAAGVATVELHLDEGDGEYTVIDIGHLVSAVKWSKHGTEPSQLTLICAPGVARTQLATELPNVVIVAEGPTGPTGCECCERDVPVSKLPGLGYRCNDCVPHVSITAEDPCPYAEVKP